MTTTPLSSTPTYLGPNWFAAVMGTGIIANAGATVPIHLAGLHEFCVLVWITAATVLASLLVATVLHGSRRRDLVRRYGDDIQLAQFYGAPPMALLTVGAGAVLVGTSVIGARAAVDLDWVLWILGTAGGLATAVVIPYRLFTSMAVRPDAAFGGWLMPVVPPMVSASTGALLIPHLASVDARATMLYGCEAMFGLSLVAALIVITMIWSRLAHYGTSSSARVPTLWIVLGPLGQSITAVGLLGAQAHLAVAPTIASAMGVFAILYGVPVWGFALLWAALALALTVRTARRHLPFALTWWSFTFPVGVTVTGTIRLALQTGLPAFRDAAVVGYALLVAAWLLVAVRTAHGLLRGRLLTISPLTSGPVATGKEQRETLPTT